MIVRQYAPCSLGRSIICLGKQGEINALRVEFDVSAWMAMYPDATVKLMHFAPDRPQDNPIIPTLGVEGTLRVWIVGEEDTAGAGNGVIELLLIDERTGSTIKSATGYTTVLRSPSAGIEAQEAEAGYVRYDVDQSAMLTDEQKAVARKNIGAGTGDGTGGGTGGITQETDPTVPVWAKQPSKPTYTASEVGARPDTWTPSASDVGADAAGTASGALSAHNTSGSAHADLRALIEGLNSRLNALADSDDTTLDQLSEIVAYIKSNKALIDAVTTGKVSVSDIVDNLKTNASGKVLSAAQGVALKRMIDAIVIPTALPNPQPITINGQRYDGSEEVTVTVSSEGGGTPVEIDDTLTQSGKAADAKAVGDRLSALNEANETQDGRLTALESNADKSSAQICMVDLVTADTANAPEPLDITTHASGGNQPIHPKVLYIKDGFGGHPFWMAYTPYPGAADAAENPCIACSDDLVNWAAPEGVNNPLDTGTSTVYMSDTHLVFNPDTKLLEVWYRRCDTINAVETIFRRTSADGKVWNEREVMFETPSTGYSGYANFLSPTIIYENGVYKIWAGNKSVFTHYTSTDGTNWQLVAETNLAGWHIDIIHTDIGYEAVIDDTMNGATLSYAVSSDGITWGEKTQIMSAGEAGSWDSSKLYRSSLLKSNGIYYLFYTGVYNNVWKIGLSISAEKDDISSLRGYVSGYATVESLEAAYKEIKVLKSALQLLESRVAALESGSIAIRSITLSTPSATINPGAKLQLTATVEPSNATGDIAWTSSSSAASVSDNGLVTGVADGEATIKAYAVDNSNVYAECLITVSSVSNILAGVELHNGFVNANTGEIGTSTTEVYSDAFDVAAYAGQNISIDFGEAVNGKYSNERIVFYDASGGFISSTLGYGTDAFALHSEVPSNAFTARIGGPIANLTTISVRRCENVFNIDSNLLTGQYYDAATGNIKTESGINSIKTNVNAVDGIMFVKNIVSGAAFDESGVFLFGISYFSGMTERAIRISGEARAFGLNFKSTTITSDIYAWCDDELLGTVSYA